MLHTRKSFNRWRWIFLKPCRDRLRRMDPWSIEWHPLTQVSWSRFVKNGYFELICSDVPVFRVRAATAPTSTTIKTDAKPISMTTTTGLSYEPKQIHSTATGGSVSVLACFKTTKTRNKVRWKTSRWSIRTTLCLFRNARSCLDQVPLMPLIIHRLISSIDWQRILSTVVI